MADLEEAQALVHAGCHEHLAIRVELNALHHSLAGLGDIGVPHARGLDEAGRQLSRPRQQPPCRRQQSLRLPACTQLGTSLLRLPLRAAIMQNATPLGLV